MRFADEFGYYELNPFPGCNQIVISNHAFIYEQWRGKGYGKRQHEERLRKAKELGYNYIICTVRIDNEVERAILAKYNWTFLYQFLNRETNHIVLLYGKTLND